MSEKNIDFGELIRKMNDAPRYGKNGPHRLTILGGQFTPERLAAFLAGLARAVGSNALAHLGAHQ